MYDSTWQALEACNYEAKSGLTYVNEFTFLVAILLSAQARDEFINTQTPALFKEAPDAERMCALGIDTIAFFIQKIGLWRNKAKNIHALAKKVCEFKEIYKQGNQNAWYQNFEGEGDDLKLYGDPISSEGLPSFRLGLLELAGIGRKSANVFLNVIYDAPVFPVDTHVQRVGNRLGVAVGDNPLEIEKMMQESVPEEYAAKACHWLVWHGRKICLARKPKCSECSLKNYCNYYQNMVKK